jgi:DNA-binding transcriptional ArsR family regulator
MSRTQTLIDLPAIQALTHPIRVRMLDALREPATAAAVARVIGETRQKTNYHLKELERAGLVRAVTERRNGHVMEQLYQATAGTFLVSPRVAWSDERRPQALRDQAALAALVDLGERVNRDAVALLDRAAFDGDEISSAVVDADVAFADASARSAFMREYLELLGPLLKKHGAQHSAGERYRVALAVYPQTEEETVQ